MKRWTLMLMVALLFGVPAVAEEIIYFTNGNQMPIRAYAVEDDMIKVDLGDNAFMAFPIAHVERIEKAGKDVFLNPSRANQQFTSSGDSNASFPVHGRRPATRQKSRRLTVDELKARGSKNIGRDRNGMTVYKPYAGGSHAGKARLSAAGHQMVLNGPAAQDASEGIVGARRIGTKHVINSGNMPNPDKYGARALPFQRADLTGSGSTSRSATASDDGAANSGDGAEAAGGDGAE